MLLLHIKTDPTFKLKGSYKYNNNNGFKSFSIDNLDVLDGCILQRALNADYKGIVGGHIRLKVGDNLYNNFLETAYM